MSATVNDSVFTTPLNARPFGTVVSSRLLNDSLVAVTPAGSPVFARIGPRFCAVSSNGRSGLPHGSSEPACAEAQLGYVQRRVSLPIIAAVAACLAAVVRDLAVSGARSTCVSRRVPGVNPCDTSRHGLVASRLRTLGSGALRCCTTATNPPALRPPRHQTQRGRQVAPLPVRLPGPRVTAAGCCVKRPTFGPATPLSRQIDAAHCATWRAQS